MILVHLAQIPPEGKSIQGEEDPGFLELAAVGGRALGPVSYDLEVGLSGGGLFATGRIGVPVELQCVACLNPFRLEVVVDPFAVQLEIDGREAVDLTSSVREELLLALPNHPRCDWNNGSSCSYTPPALTGDPPGTSGAGSIWGELDKLNLNR